MTQTGRRFPLMRLSALLLTAGLLLSGCTGGTPAADNSGAPDGSPHPHREHGFQKIQRLLRCDERYL